jgi:hypothetical protein
LKERETLASTVTTLPSGMALLNATWFTDAVTTILRNVFLLQYLLRDPFGNNSPPKDYSKGLFHLVKLNQWVLLRIQKDILIHILK